MQYAQELEQSNQALRDFLFIASPDLQEPLRADLLEKRAKDLDLGWSCIHAACAEICFLRHFAFFVAFATYDQISSLCHLHLFITLLFMRAAGGKISMSLLIERAKHADSKNR